MDNFAVFILTHGRPDNVVTYRTLRNQGYTGNIFIIVDNEDKKIDEYRRIYGNEVVVFDKLAVSKTFDTGDNFNNRQTVVYARNACFEIAKTLNIDYFLQLDDDYTNFCYAFDSNFNYINNDRRVIKNLDGLFFNILDFYKMFNPLTLAFAQSGDKIGGAKGSFGEKIFIKRKAMNSFFCCTTNKFSFVGRVNEDVNTYVNNGNRGGLFITINNVFLFQLTTQKNKGGMTDTYLSEGTYIKSFYTLMYNPSCVVIVDMGTKHKRLHHRISWNNAVPKIVSPEHRKASTNSTQ